MGLLGAGQLLATLQRAKAGPQRMHLIFSRRFVARDRVLVGARSLRQGWIRPHPPAHSCPVPGDLGSAVGDGAGGGPAIRRAPNRGPGTAGVGSG